MMPNLDPTTNPDVQEALSRRYSDDIVMLLPLRSSRLAVFNAARELCGFLSVERDQHERIMSVWHPPAAAPTLTKPPVDLEELDLI
jgi:hypothetical protein